MCCHEFVTHKGLLITVARTLAKNVANSVLKGTLCEPILILFFRPPSFSGAAPSGPVVTAPVDSDEDSDSDRDRHSPLPRKRVRVSDINVSR